MAKIAVINGPNLNALGRRDTTVYGAVTLAEIQAKITQRAQELLVDVEFFQSNSEGAIVDHIQNMTADGIIINPGALTHYGYSLRDALADTGLRIVEVHLSNIHAREEWRRKSVVAEVATGQISGFGWRGYITALEILSAILNETGGL